MGASASGARVYYCCRCRRPQIVAAHAKPTLCPGVDPKAPCRGKYFSDEPQLVERPLVWTEQDRNLLRAWRIAVDGDCA